MGFAQEVFIVSPLCPGKQAHEVWSGRRLVTIGGDLDFSEKKSVGWERGLCVRLWWIQASSTRLCTPSSAWSILYTDRLFERKLDALYAQSKPFQFNACLNLFHVRCVGIMMQCLFSHHFLSEWPEMASAVCAMHRWPTVLPLSRFRPWISHFLLAQFCKALRAPAYWVP
jgi:hypothetical protein